MALSDSVHEKQSFTGCYLSLAKVEEAYKHEEEAKTLIEKAIQLRSFAYLQEGLDSTDDEADEDRLLPAMNKIWPYMILCMKNKVSLDVTISLAKVEEAYKHEKEAKILIEKAIQLSSFADLQEGMDSIDDEADENRLLPTMNKIWPYLMLCMKNKVSVAVTTRCTGVISRVVQISGGDFFIRRFHNDGPVIWKFLASSLFQRKPITSTQTVLPYRSTQSSEDSMAEVSSLKIQIAVLNMIAELSSNKRSASAIGGVIKKVSGLVVGIACSSVIGLRDASIKALSGLACIDTDLIWLLLADVYYSSISKNMPQPQPPTPYLPDICQLLPPPLSPKDHLYMH